MTELSLTKHHALGNDFLVLVDLDGRHPVDAALARWLCDRRWGVGADGLLRARAGGDRADVAMEVRNADGSEAETSGNGLRCLAQAVLDAGVVTGPHLTVATGAGIRHLAVSPGRAPDEVDVRVEMGPAELGPERPGWGRGQRARTVGMGNPHLVVLDGDGSAASVASADAPPEAVRADVNVELVAVGPGGGEITMRVWERGVGETLACGSGACAAAAALNAWGLVGPRVRVNQPGGAVQVDVEADTVVLTGPAQRVARIHVDVP